MSSSKSQRTICLILTDDTDVLDCCICYEALAIPVFQCPNGHLLCSSCHSKLNKTCPVCCTPVGNNRSRAIEKFIESIKVKCQNAEYGCEKTMNYDNNYDDHENRCSYTPCFCPFLDCDFGGSSAQLGKHVYNEHYDDVTSFEFLDEFEINIRVDQKHVLLLESETNTLFFLYNRIEPLGNVISVCQIAPTWIEDFFLYEIMAKSDGESRVMLETFTKSIDRQVTILHQKGTSSFHLISSALMAKSTWTSAYRSGLDYIPCPSLGLSIFIGLI